MNKNDIHKSFTIKNFNIINQHGEILDTQDHILIKELLAKDIRLITELAEYQLYADINLLKDLDTFQKENPNISQNNTIGARLGIKIPQEIFINRKSGNSRLEFIYQDKVIREAKSWLERIKAVRGDSNKYISNGWKRTKNATQPTNLKPKISLSSVNSQYAQIINNPFADSEIHLKMVIAGKWYYLLFPFDKERFTGAYKISLPDIRINEKGRIVFDFTAIYEYNYSYFSDNYIIGVDVGINNYVTVSVIDIKSSMMVYSSTLSQRVHSLYNSSRKTARQVTFLRKKGKLDEAALHRHKNINKKRELAIIAGQEIADLSVHYGNAIVVFEDLSHINNTMMFGRWNRGALMKWTKHFVELNGGRVTKVNAAYTSQNCYKCGNQGSFNDYSYISCKHCHTIMDRDVNAACNIGLRFVRYHAFDKFLKTRKSGKKAIKKVVRRSPVKRNVLKYPGRDRSKNYPTPKQVKKRKKLNNEKEVFSENNGSVISNLAMVITDDIIYDYVRTLKEQPDSIFKRYNLYE